MPLDQAIPRLRGNSAPEAPMEAGRVRTENRWFWFDSGPDPGDQYMSNLLLVLSVAGFWLVGGNPHAEPTSIRKIKRLKKSFWCSQASTLKQNCAGGTDGGGGARGHLLQMNQNVGSTCGHRRHGATAARLTPDQKVGSSNLFAVMLSERPSAFAGSPAVPIH